MMDAASAAAHAQIAPDPERLVARAADWLAGAIAATPGGFRLVLSGGATPRPLYRLLASDAFAPRIDWPSIEFFFGDERMVPHTHPDSNCRMARQTLLDHVPVTAQAVHPMPTDGTAQDCARRYETLLQQRYGRDAFDPAEPLFDVVLLGMGADGHTASLLPGEPVLEDRTHWVAAVPHGRSEARLTLTYPAIASSRHVAFLVTGAEKARAVAAMRAGDARLPAARIASDGEVIWFLDRAAAGTL
jgi:6-phosphogluconolactonase